MKSLFLGVALGAAAFSAIPSAVLAQTSVSVSVGQPGFFGRLDVGNFAPAPVLYGPRPVVIAPAPVYGVAPVYLRVPRYQRMSWARYCSYYDACGLPVLFVRDDWYTRTYVPAYRAYYGPPRGWAGPRPYAYGYGRVDHRYHGGPGWDHGRPGWDHGRPGGWDHGHGGYGGHAQGFAGGHGGGHGPGYGGHGGDHGAGHGGGHGGEHGGHR